MDLPIHTASTRRLAIARFLFLVAPLLLVDCTYPSSFPRIVSRFPPCVYHSPHCSLHTYNLSQRNTLSLTRIDLSPLCGHVERLDWIERILGTKAVCSRDFDPRDISRAKRPTLFGATKQASRNCDAHGQRLPHIRQRPLRRVSALCHKWCAPGLSFHRRMW